MECKKCKISMILSINLRRTNYDQYKCPECGHTFNFKADLNKVPDYVHRDVVSG